MQETASVSTVRSSTGGAAGAAPSPAAPPAAPPPRRGRAARKRLTYALLPNGKVDAVRVSSGPQGETRVEVRHRDGSFTEVDPEKAPEYQEGVQRFEQLKARNPKQAAMVAARAGVDPDEEPSQPSEAAQEQPEQEPREPEAQESDNEGPEEPETPEETERDTGETKRDDDETRGKRGVLV